MRKKCEWLETFPESKIHFHYNQFQFLLFFLLSLQNSKDLLAQASVAAK